MSSEDYYSLEAVSQVPNLPCISSIRNIVNGKEYIGKTQALKRRLQKHLSVYLKGESILYKAMLKHGVANFVVEIIEHTLASEHGAAFDKEVYNIKLRSTMAPLGYNMTEGGEGMLGRKMTEATKAKKRLIAASNPEYVQKFKEFVRRPKSPEHKQAISLSNRKPKEVKRYGAEAPSSKAVMLFEKDSLTPKYFATQKDLAGYLEVHKTSVGNWLRGSRCSLHGVAIAGM